MSKRWTVLDIQYLAPSLHILECAYLLNVLYVSTLPLDTWTQLEEGLKHYGIEVEGKKYVDDIS